MKENLSSYSQAVSPHFVREGFRGLEKFNFSIT